MFPHTVQHVCASIRRSPFGSFSKARLVVMNSLGLHLFGKCFNLFFTFKGNFARYSILHRQFFFSALNKSFDSLLGSQLCA